MRVNRVTLIPMGHLWMTVLWCNRVTHWTPPSLGSSLHKKRRWVGLVSVPACLKVWNSSSLEPWCLHTSIGHPIELRCTLDFVRRLAHAQRLFSQQKAKVFQVGGSLATQWTIQANRSTGTFFFFFYKVEWRESVFDCRPRNSARCRQGVEHNSQRQIWTPGQMVTTSVYWYPSKFALGYLFTVSLYAVLK